MTTTNMRKNATVLTHEQIKIVAPTVFTPNKHERTSDKYNHYSTIRLVEAMEEEGWQPIQAFEAKVRKEGKDGFQFHSVRFQHPEYQLSSAAQVAVGDLVMGNAILTNSHYGDASFSLSPGVQRKVCSNGACVSIGGVRFSHNSASFDDIKRAQEEVMKTFPEIARRIREFRTMELTESQRVELARKALELRWGKPSEGKTSPVSAHDLLTTRRTEDKGSDLFTTWNVIQENVLEGGLLGVGTNGRARKTRAVGSILANLSLNRKLWGLMEETALLINS